MQVFRKLLAQIGFSLSAGLSDPKYTRPISTVKYPPQPGDGDSPQVAAGRTRLAVQRLVNEEASMQR